MKRIAFIILLITVFSGCSGKLYNEITFYLIPGIECYYPNGGFLVNFTLDDFRVAMEVLYYKYSETNITLEILQQLEKTDTVILGIIRPSLKTSQYSSQNNFSKLASRDIDVWNRGLIYRLKSSSGNVFLFTPAVCLYCVYMASEDFRVVYLKDLTFSEEQALEKEFETELLPKIKECVEIVKQRKKIENGK